MLKWVLSRKIELRLYYAYIHFGFQHFIQVIKVFIFQYSKMKQKVIVTFIDDGSIFDDLPIGILSEYADPAKRELEKGSFERSIVEKHSNG